jgi:hypothetical protein
MSVRSISVREAQNTAVLTAMRAHQGSGWWAAAPLASAVREILGFSCHAAARVAVDRALRRLRRRGLIESSGSGLWRAKS